MKKEGTDWNSQIWENTEGPDSPLAKPWLAQSTVHWETLWNNPELEDLCRSGADCEVPQIAASQHWTFRDTNKLNDYWRLLQAQEIYLSWAE